MLSEATALAAQLGFSPMTEPELSPQQLERMEAIEKRQQAVYDAGLFSWGEESETILGFFKLANDPNASIDSVLDAIEAHLTKLEGRQN